MTVAATPAFGSAVALAENGLLPDFVVRAGIRRLLAGTLRAQSRGGPARRASRLEDEIEEWSSGPIAPVPHKANEQHYEIPAQFMALALGPRMKYSCAWYPNGTETLAQAEEAMLALTCDRAQLSDGQRILELGCGWGSLSLWMAEQFPRSRITAVSNSASQREFITARARSRGLSNLEVLTSDMNDFSPTQRFDRVVSVEMFEHMRNHPRLMKRIASWLRPGGKLFVHVFCHREFAYPFIDEGETDWMTRYFFAGGLMPAEHLLPRFQDDLAIERHWTVEGTHYEKTSNDWLRNLDARRDEGLRLLKPLYGKNAALWLRRWRIFYMACAELFGHRGGDEWRVAHYRFRKRNE